MDLIGGKYRILKTLGQGAMGEVFLVLPSRGDPVALKLLKTAESGNIEAAIEQFENEFKVLKKLSHPNIGRIHDYGFDESQNKVYFTSPWLKGTDLFVATKNLPFDKVEEYFIQVLRALNYLHQKNIIHCDLKPGNVFVENDNILLIDFGLAGYFGESIVGTPTYLAPEVFQGTRHSVTSDLYAVGVMLYNCFTRTQPFSGKNLQEVFDRHRNHMPQHISVLNPAIPKYIGDIALTLLSKKPEERFQNAAAVIEEISAFSKHQYSVETQETLLSYLPKNSELIGRSEAQSSIESLVARYFGGVEDKSLGALYIYGDSGCGKSKFLSQIKIVLQLEKISIEDVTLPLAESDIPVLKQAKVMILEDLENYLENVDGKWQPKEELKNFLSLLEERILDTKANRFVLLVSGQNLDLWPQINTILPQEDLISEVVSLPGFSEAEAREFLEGIIGQKPIPEDFVSEIYRNTGGNPGLIQQLIESLIHQRLLFDESGRWSADLITHLSDVLDKVETPKSLEEKIALEYKQLDAVSQEALRWLALCPNGLSLDVFEKLLPGQNAKLLCDRLLDDKIIRSEKDIRYTFYKSAFEPFLLKSMSDEEKLDRHARLGSFDLSLSDKERLYHQGRGRDINLAQTALETLAEKLIQDGDRLRALDCYYRLLNLSKDMPILQRVTWIVKASEMLIWLDRFQEAIDLMTDIEDEITKSQQIPTSLILMFWEKKGLALLHLQKIKEASAYFAEGVNRAKESQEYQVEEIRLSNDLAQVEILTGHPERAIIKFELARVRTRELKSEEAQKITNNDLGHVYFRMRNFKSAIELLEEDIRVFSLLPNKEPLARAVYTLAECYRSNKEPEKALDRYQYCIEICKRDHFLPILLRTYNGLGNVYLINKQYQEALDSYQRAIEISVHLKDTTTRSALLANQGLIYRGQKNWPLATRRFLLAKQLLEAKESRLVYELQLLSKCYSELAMIAREENNSMKAVSYQVERVKLIENSDTLRPDAFQGRLDLIELYLENRLVDAFRNEYPQVEKLVRTDEEREKLKVIKERFDAIAQFDQDSTAKLS